MSDKPRFAIAVHCGAGYHCPSTEKELKALMNKACIKAAEVLQWNSSSQIRNEFQILFATRKDCLTLKMQQILAAVGWAMKILEDSELTNAGLGSSLNIDGFVEADAGITLGYSKDDKEMQRFASIGAASGLENPSLCAIRLLIDRLNVDNSILTPPSMLFGDGLPHYFL